MRSTDWLLALAAVGGFYFLHNRGGRKLCQAMRDAAANGYKLPDGRPLKAPVVDGALTICDAQGW